ncbi:MAG: putative sulfate/molybdate transporter [bacterium]
MSRSLGRLDRHEIAGGLGDAGLFIPIAVALVAINGLNATAVFAGAGLVYIATALFFAVPVPVQPLKAFAAAAIALELDAATIAAGALLMALAMGLLVATRLARWLADRFPLVLVRGIQAAVALLLAKAAIELAARGNWSGLAPIDAVVGFALAAGACALLFLASERSSRFPGSLVVLGGGAVVGIAVSGLPGGLDLGPQQVAISIPHGGAFATALTALVIAQLPLTFGNSVVATADAERSYFGGRACRVTPGRLAASIGLSNLAAGLSAGLPVCHGAGGVTAHYRLGARAAVATIFTGGLYLTLGVVFGRSLPALLTLLVPGALAGMLGFVAIQHGLLAARLERLDERLIAGGVGVVTLATGNLAIGFGAGVLALAARRGWRRLRPAGAPSPTPGSTVAAPTEEAYAGSGVDHLVRP